MPVILMHPKPDDCELCVMLPKISGKEALLVQGAAGENNSGAAAPGPKGLLCPLWDGHSCPAALEQD